MNTKSNNFKVAPGFEDMFSFECEEEKMEHRAQMISYRILSEMEKICQEKNIKMKELAEMVNTSASYITQLFRGYKQVNTAFMAKFEEAMNLVFDFSLQSEKEQHDENFRMELTAEALKKLKKLNPGYNFYGAKAGGSAIKTDQLLEEMQKEEKNKQAA
jgi:transcriptional regulator with XRE-family HTH domain